MELSIIKKLIQLLNESNLKKMHLRDGEFEISLEKEDAEGCCKTPTMQAEIKSEKVPIENERIFSENDYVLSPMVGTFYSSPSPEATAFVKIADRVNENSIVCIIEAMKVMNEIKAGKSGVIKEILIDNGHPVEYGTKMFRVE